jgi:hypothetical protein
VKRSPLKRSRKPLRRQSQKRRAERGPRAACMVIVRVRANGLCEARIPGAGCTGVGVHGHELLRRSQGGSITDPANVVLVCFECHHYLHSNVADAVALGLLKRRSEAA